MDSVPCLTELLIAFVMCHFGKNYMGMRRAQIYHIKWVEKSHAGLCKFL